MQVICIGYLCRNVNWQTLLFIEILGDTESQWCTVISTVLLHVHLLLKVWSLCTNKIGGDSWALWGRVFHKQKLIINLEKLTRSLVCRGQFLTKLSGRFQCWGLIENDTISSIAVKIGTFKGYGDNWTLYT